MAISADEFNTAAEQYYRGPLRTSHMDEAFDYLMAEARRVDFSLICTGRKYHQAFKQILGGLSACRFVEIQKKAMMNNRITTNNIQKTIHFLILVIHGNHEHSKRYLQTGINQ